jgi:UDP-glucose:tetrahydrobiopterin glucosyltransferase
MPRGGPTEIVRDGQTGFLVEPDSIDGLIAAIKRLGAIDRAACRRQAEQEYSAQAWGNQLEEWFIEMHRLARAV